MSDENRLHGDDDALRRLLRAAGRGPKADADARQRIYRAVHETWRAEHAQRRAARPAPAWQRFAMAAGIAALALTVYFLQAPSPGPGAVFASISQVAGNVMVSRDGEGQTMVALADDIVRVGDTVMTRGEGGRIALRLNSGATLRVDSGTDLVVASADTVRLRDGTVYFDSNDVVGAPLNVATAFGSVSHTGTQYEARVSDSGLRLRVREGSIAFRDATREFTAAAGDELQVMHTGVPLRSAIAPGDPAWQWTEELVLLDQAAEHRVADVLRWVARQTGRVLRYSDEATGLRAEEVVVTGLGGLTPNQALQALADTTAFVFRRSEQELLIESDAR